MKTSGIDSEEEYSGSSSELPRRKKTIFPSKKISLSTSPGEDDDDVSYGSDGNEKDEVSKVADPSDSKPSQSPTNTDKNKDEEYFHANCTLIASETASSNLDLTFGSSNDFRPQETDKSSGTDTLALTFNSSLGAQENDQVVDGRSSSSSPENIEDKVTSSERIEGENDEMSPSLLANS